MVTETAAKKIDVIDLIGGIFYAAAVPCLIGALFLVFLYFARPVMEADAEGHVAPVRGGHLSGGVAGQSPQIAKADQPSRRFVP